MPTKEVGVSRPRNSIFHKLAWSLKTAISNFQEVRPGRPLRSVIVQFVLSLFHHPFFAQNDPARRVLENKAHLIVNGHGEIDGQFVRWRVRENFQPKILLAFYLHYIGRLFGQKHLEHLAGSIAEGAVVNEKDIGQGAFDTPTT